MTALLALNKKQFKVQYQQLWKECQQYLLKKSRGCQVSISLRITHKLLYQQSIIFIYLLLQTLIPFSWGGSRSYSLVPFVGIKSAEL